MKLILANILISLVFFVFMDIFWFSVFMKKFSIKKLHSIININDGKISVKLPSAITVYALMVLIAVFFLAPLVSTLTNQLIIFLYGALMGACVFGIYDFTNHATIKDYPISFALVDTSWGALMYGGLALIFKKFSMMPHMLF